MAETIDALLREFFETTSYDETRDWRLRLDLGEEEDEDFEVLGGPGSGHFGHAGRPGEVGGSAPAEGQQSQHSHFQSSPSIAAEISKQAWRTSVPHKLAPALVKSASLTPEEAVIEVKKRNDLWSSTSSGNERASQMQYAVKEELGLTDATTDHLINVDHLAKLPLDRQYVRAEYEATQEWFKERGIKEVTLYRGQLSGLPENKDLKEFDITMQPASSWTLTQSLAHQFTATWHSPKSGVMEIRVPVSRILSIGGVTGRGSSGEDEMLVLGGPARVRRLS